MNTTPKRRSIRHLVIGALVLVSAALTCAWVCTPIYRQHKLTRGLEPELITAIRIKPNADNTIILLSSENIAAFIDWLATTRDASSLRSVPPATQFEGFIQFADGRREPLFCSAILPPLASDDNLDSPQRWQRNILTPRSDVRISFRGILRSGERQSLARLISPQESNMPSDMQPRGE